ncbi:MAG TPA: aroma-sacti cluster domain-containing protein [Pilimelia sp.]|nr:aroma-sacti cluster domain-containing protein [Pilimelia sp.]
MLESLSDAELALLVEIRRRLDDGDDVEGHAVDGGGLVW